MSLQSLAIETFLRNLPVNEKSQEGIEKFIVDYVFNHQNVLTQCITRCGTYHVFFRERDPYVTGRMMVDATPDMSLISTFGTESEAVDWTTKHGSIIINNLKSIHPCILTIVYTNGLGNDHGISHYMISSGKHLSFAFDDAGYRMLLDEHFIMYKEAEYTDMIPYWIRYIKEDGEMIYGCILEDLKNLLAGGINYDHTELIIEFQKFQADPLKSSQSTK